MTIQLAYKKLLAQLYDVYDTREAANIANMVIEHVTGQRKIDRIVYKDMPVTNEQQQTLQKLTEQLIQHKPVQYVLGEAWFADMKLYVNEHVLIPRPETEELVEWIIGETIQNARLKMQYSILDVGTGSGCIPIALKKKLQQAILYAVDVSTNALQVAKQNAVKQAVEVTFIEIDFLNKNLREQLPKVDIIVSNPPYIKKSEEQTMAANVLKYEPHIALFVADEDALKFYKAIAEFANTNLLPNGSIYVEINEALGEQVTELFKQNGFTNTVLKKDLQGKDRMIRASS